MTLSILAALTTAGIRAWAPLAAAQGEAPPPQAPAQPPPPSARDLYAAKLAKQRQMQRLRVIFRDEPTIKEVQEWAMHYYRLEPERINSQAAAARVKGLVPDIQASLTNMTGTTFTNMKDGLYLGLPLGADGSTCSGGNSAFCGYKELTAQNQGQLTWEIQASWGLDKLVFNPEELDARSTVSLEETLIREVTTMYYSRRRLIAGLVLSPPESEEEVFYEQLRIEEMTANLNSFTNQQFGERAYKGDFGPAAAAAAAPPQ